MQRHIPHPMHQQETQHEERVQNKQAINILQLYILTRHGCQTVICNTCPAQT